MGFEDLVMAGLEGWFCSRQWYRKYVNDGCYLW